MKVHPKLAWDGLEALNELNEQDLLILPCIPGHRGHKNDEAILLALEGASKVLIQNSFVARTSIKNRVMDVAGILRIV